MEPVCASARLEIIMTMHTRERDSPRLPRSLPTPHRVASKGIFAKILATIRIWFHRPDHLSDLPPRLRRDVGLPITKPPKHWQDYR
jgi:hypothetical protein